MSDIYNTLEKQAKPKEAVKGVAFNSLLGLGVQIPGTFQCLSLEEMLLIITRRGASTIAAQVAMLNVILT